MWCSCNHLVVEEVLNSCLFFKDLLHKISGFCTRAVTVVLGLPQPHIYNFTVLVLLIVGN